MSDKRFVDAYDKIELDPESADRIWSRLEQELLPGKENEQPMKTRKTLRIALIAAAISILFITSAYAVSGVVHGTGTHIMKDTGSYDSLADLPKAERIAGYPVTAPEKFSNGYGFETLYLGGEEAFGENFETLKEYYSVMVNYARDGKSDLTLNLSPVLDLPTEREAPAPTSSKEISGVEVRYSLDHYKIVPPDYEKTEEDLAAEGAGHYYISFGSDEIEEYDFSFADFELGDVQYVFHDQSGRDADFLYEMAEEVIAAFLAE